MKPNFLFIMADQLRADYLGCTGHPTIRTPTIDGFASEGMQFNRAFVQAPVCGPSRMSFYTGRYVINHGATYNNVPLRVGEPTLGDHLRPLGYRVALVGKTHMRADIEGMERLGVDPGSSRGVLAAECGFEPYERDDGLHPDQSADPDLAYNRYLRAKGYEGDNPWHDYANAADDGSGDVASGWYLRNAHRPARVPAEDSETAYMTDRAMDFISEAGDQPWCLHLSYIKPHWPYMAPAPYHDMYGPEDIKPPNRSEMERKNEHPVVAAFRQHEESRNFSDDSVRERVIPTYMGMITQLDDELARLFAYLREKGLMENTVIVLTSDHGDFLGDHWLGEKDLMYEEAERIPLLIRMPGGVRGQSDALVEAIDLAPTFVDLAGGPNLDHVLEGRSLAPLLRGEDPGDNWRDAVVSEMDYAWRHARNTLGVEPDAARTTMLRTEQWKYVHYRGFRPQLFDLHNDPGEHRDLANEPEYSGILRDMADRLFSWMERRRTRITVSNERVASLTGKARERGYIFGAW
ncbi:alkaline phosphatase family protein [Aquisalimonas lutea]|uniref:alkaline phosphatase family protein n=1 Tax=Aquisalimonas lutea TaxID=1327750 RepID=UPI0025B4A892|nr:alkaline phosphatase family protein [Aquisalimonas lutea]MDN3518236.1 alkaline phosphatase family protein [Aquisalimonas lutea]